MRPRVAVRCAAGLAILLAACGGGESTGPATGRLAVTVTGLPAGTAAEVTVTGPGTYSRPLTGSETLEGLAPGGYTVTAAPVDVGGQSYAGTPFSQVASVSGGATANALVSYGGGASSGLNLRIDAVYLTQSVQTYTGTVPLVAGRDGYLRVFVRASEPNLVSPVVRVRFYHDEALVGEQTIARAGTTPVNPQEGTLSSSWNVAVPGSLIRAGLALRVEVDPADLLPETDETDNAFPQSGLPLLPEVRAASPFQVTLVPVVTSVDGRAGNVTAGNKDQFLTATMRMHPLSSYDAAVGDPLTVDASVPALDAGNTNGAWNTILSELATRRNDDGSSRYYLGVVNPAYSSGVAGIGYVSHPVALAWDKLPSAASVAAHEWGHNWGRQHAPCGGAGNPDQQFPYTDGSIGVYGLDVATLAIKAPSFHDLMGYCSNEWISDYTYRGVMDYRGAEPGVADGFGTAVQSALIVWGRMDPAGLVLEPAFQTETRPVLPARSGGYLLEARAADGSRIFSFGFDPVAVADDPQGARHFSFAVPLAPERAARVATLRVEGEGRSAVLRAGAGSSAATVQVSRGRAGRVALRWDAARTPMVIVRDPRTGRILSFARGGRTEVMAGKDGLRLTLSDRLRSRDVQVRVP